MNYRVTSVQINLPVTGRAMKVITAGDSNIETNNTSLVRGSNSDFFKEMSIL